MNAMILAAGFGTRMGDLTKDKPKPLIKINNTTLIEITIKKLFASGVNNIVINTHYLADKIIEHLKGYKNLIFIKEESILESGGGIINAIDYLTDEFLVINSDVVFDYNLKDLVLRDNYLANLVLVNNPAYNKNGDFSYNNQRLTFSGIGIYRKELFNSYKVEKIKLAAILNRNITKIEFSYHQQFWLDIGTPQRLSQAKKLTELFT